MYLDPAWWAHLWHIIIEIVAFMIAYLIFVIFG
jgi:hypothetical protein